MKGAKLGSFWPPYPMVTVYMKTKKSNDREKSIAALCRQLVSPSRSVAPHYEGFPHNDSVTLIESNPSHLVLDKF
jgi:hypothetical protein